MGAFLNMWKQIPEGDRRLIRLTAIVCMGLIVLTFVSLWAIVSLSPPTPQSNDPQTAKNESPQNVPPTYEPDSLHPRSSVVSEYEVDPELPLEAIDFTAHREIIEMFKNRRDYNNALPHIERIAPRYQEDYTFQSQAGEAYLNSGMPEEAALYLARAHKLNPDDPKLNADLALSLFRSGQPKQAIQGLRNKLQKHPGQFDLQLQLGAMLAELNPKDTEADSLLQDLEKRYPQRANVFYQHSRKAMNQGNYGQALRLLKTAAELEPLDHRIHARMGMAEYYLRNDVKAERNYRTALALNPKDYNTWYNLGELYLAFSLGSSNTQNIRTHNRKALTCFLNTLALKQGHASAHYKTGLLLNNNHQYKEAIPHLEQALQQQTQNVDALLQLSIAWEALNDYTKARELLSRAYEIDPFNRVVATKLKLLRDKS